MKEKVDFNNIKLFIETYENSTLSYDSNIPVSSKVEYTVSVPVLEEVATVTSITDEQDMMIVDMATQLAILEMTM